MAPSAPPLVHSGQLLILSAPSGAGKTTLAHALADRLRAEGKKVAFSVSFTTRAPRPGEQNGQDYHFVDEAQFERMSERGEFLEEAGVFGRRYGTGHAATLAALAKQDLLILDIDWQGARQVKTLYPQALSVFILPPSAEELLRRLQGRGQDSEDVIAARMAAAEAEMAHADEFDRQLVNDEFSQALEALLHIVAAEPQPMTQITP